MYRVRDTRLDRVVAIKVLAAPEAPPPRRSTALDAAVQRVVEAGDRT